MNSTTSKTLPIQHPGFINGYMFDPSYNAYAYPGKDHLYPQKIDIPIGCVNSYTECLEQPPCYQLHDPATNHPTHPAPSARKDIVSS
uniref:Uncharacterized protein n=1 Tax=Acrobeloides nanus TaxID=290746 RepID=A0A914DG84_9BILA